MSSKTEKSPPGTIRSFCAGFGMGVANVIPGVSGGTVAFITGIFEPLVEAISTIASGESIKLFCTFRWKKLFRKLPLKFFISLFAGILIALVTASKLVLAALENHPAETFAVFLGMMLASVAIMWKDVKKWNFSACLSFIPGCAVAFAVVNLVPVATPQTWWMACIAGAISIMAMILPGLSGSFLLLIIGQYTVLWGAVANLPQSLFTAECITIISFFAGAAVGLAVFAKVLKLLFSKYHDTTVALLIGFMAGSLPRLWPWNRDTLFSVKLDGNITSMRLPGDSAALEAARSAGADITALEFEYGMPENFTWSEFWQPAILIIIGVLLVIGMEFVSGHKNSTDKSTAGDAN